MTTRLTLTAATLAALLLTANSTTAIEKLTLRVSPNVSSAPSTVIVKATVTRDAGNRSLFIEAESGAFYRSSEVQLDGDKAPLITEIQLKNLPGGEYTVKAVLRDNAGDETTVRRTALVLSNLGR